MTRRAKVRVQVGDDAEIASATYDGTIDLEVSGTGRRSVRYVMAWDTAAPLPGTAKPGSAAAMGYAGTYRGPHGDRLTRAEVEMLPVRNGMQDLLEDDLDDVWALKWTTTYQDVYFDGGAFGPTGHTNMEGSVLTTHGTLGTGSYECTGTPYPPVWTIVPQRAGDGATTLTLTPFTAIVTAPDDVDCERSGYGGDYGTVVALQHAAPYAAHVTVTPAMLTQSEFTVPVTFGGAFPANCGEEPPVECKDSGTMTGAVRFLRVS
jgi:hypothetical protein